MVLGEKHYKCIELLIKGLKYTEIAKKVPCSRESIYSWLRDDNFKAELDKFQQEIKKQGTNRILAKVDTYIGRIEEIAFNSASDNVKLNALEFLYEAVCGKATTKIEQTNIDKVEGNNIADIDTMLSELDTVVDSNVIELDSKKVM